MVFFFSLFFISWVSFIVWADKKKWRQFYPTCLLAMYLACTVDFFAHHYKLWNYPAPSNEQTYWYHLSQQLGIYPIVVYLFLQWLPSRHGILSHVVYILAWSLFSILLECLTVKLGFMQHTKGWSIGHSFLADLILFVIFYGHYKGWMKLESI